MTDEQTRLLGQLGRPEVLSQTLHTAGFNGLAALAAMAERAEVPLEVLSHALRMAGFNGLAAAASSLLGDTSGASLEREVSAGPVERWERLPQPRPCRGGVLIGGTVHEADPEKVRAAAVKFARGCVTPLSEPLAHVKGELSGTGVGKFWRRAVAVCDLVAADKAAKAFIADRVQGGA